MYYEPTLLFRQNAIRRFHPMLLPIQSSDDLKRGPRLPQFSPRDTEVLDQACGLLQTDIRLSYWKIPDDNMHLTAIASAQVDEANARLAILSGRQQANLFIYDLDPDNASLRHLSTILLPLTLALHWVDVKSGWLATGNDHGYAHLVLIPKGDDASAYIGKRFNHRKYLKREFHTAKPVHQLRQFDIDKTKLLTVYDHHLFYWDIKALEAHAKPAPISVASVQGLVATDPMPKNDCIVLMAGHFGVTLLDIRELPKFQVPQTLALRPHQQPAQTVRWNPDNANQFALAHRDDIIRLYDIRMDGCVGNLKGHRGKPLQLLWTQGNLFSGGGDGNLVHWDLVTAPEQSFTNCTLKQGLGSVSFNPQTNNVEETLSQRQCGTVLPASNTSIVDMAPVSDLGAVVTIDGLGFFGYHAKVAAPKQYYTDHDLAYLERVENLAQTLVEEEITGEEILDVATVKAKQQLVPRGLSELLQETLAEPLLEPELDSSIHLPLLRVFSNTGSVLTVSSEVVDWSHYSELLTCA